MSFPRDIDLLAENLRFSSFYGPESHLNSSQGMFWDLGYENWSKNRVHALRGMGPRRRPRSRQ